MTAMPDADLLATHSHLQEGLWFGESERKGLMPLAHPRCLTLVPVDHHFLHNRLVFSIVDAIRLNERSTVDSIPFHRPLGYEPHHPM